MNLDPTETGRIEELVEDRITNSRLARVTNVEPHTDPDDYSNHRVDIEVPPNSPVKTYQDVPVSQPGYGAVHVPREDQLVVVSFFEGDGEKPYISEIIYGSADEHRAPLGNPGVIRYRNGNKYFEIQPDGEWVRIAQKAADNAEPDKKVEITDEGVTVETNGKLTVTDGDGKTIEITDESISVESDGDINISAGGDVVIDEGGTAKSVLTEDAVFEYEDTTIEDTETGSGSSSTETKTTTTVSNDETTDTEIQ